jgi:hypothetical protein
LQGHGRDPVAPEPPNHHQQDNPMLNWAITFLIIALIAAVLGFGGIAGTAISIAKLIFYVAIILFIVSAVVSLVRGRSSTPML